MRLFLSTITFLATLAPAVAADGAPAPLAPGGTPPPRLKDLVSIEGVRENQLIGYGLVVGLAGTGDRRQTLFSAQSLTNLLERMGVTVSAAAAPPRRSIIQPSAARRKAVLWSGQRRPSRRETPCACSCDAPISPLHPALWMP